MAKYLTDLSSNFRLTNGNKVQLLLLDCDGVLTDGGVTWSENGIEQKTFNIRDGLGHQALAASRLSGLVSSPDVQSKVVKWRANELSIDFCQARYWRQGRGGL
jgi:3-deoxy-D-manno-octulosonate 8-phosphate phosphatase KdsC-like HAD superfamily phosphatase